jgi:hypothetical protein
MSKLDRVAVWKLIRHGLAAQDMYPRLRYKA